MINHYEKLLQNLIKIYGKLTKIKRKSGKILKDSYRQKFRKIF